MPRYEYRCSGHDCAWAGEFLVKFDDRDGQRCPDCDNELMREEISETAPVRTRGYQMQAIFGPGDVHVPGQFGKEARRKRGTQ